MSESIYRAVPAPACWIWAKHGRCYVRWSGADRTAHEEFLQQFGPRAWNPCLRAWSLPLSEARAAMFWADRMFTQVNLHAPASRAVTARKAAAS